MNEQIKINWYRTKVDKAVMSELMKRHDAKALRQALLHLGLYACTGTAAYIAYGSISQANWAWMVPLLVLFVFLHGTFAQFMGLVAVHELVHKTPFRRQWLNDLFMDVFSFLTWSDPVSFRVSHVKHHQVTVHQDHDGEVILPQKMDWDAVKFWFWQLVPFPNPVGVWGALKKWFKYATGSLKGEGLFAGGEEWMQKVLPAENAELRRRHRKWASVVLFGHLALAAIFIATGQWILILLVNLPVFYCGWLVTLCGTPQHIGLVPNAPDFRLCCRTYTCSPFVGFLYWNMQYHVEHHMFPAVPFYNLPALRKAIAHDLPPAPHGLWATWREIIPILKNQRENPDYVFVPELPNAA
ncbi:MAG: fatty acid desaturase [Verrucomicrobia bacterium]|nr:fatty acid desaturase [Verrucomicrobiota bacterium]